MVLLLRKLQFNQEIQFDSWFMPKTLVEFFWIVDNSLDKISLRDQTNPPPPPPPPVIIQRCGLDTTLHPFLSVPLPPEAEAAAKGEKRKRDPEDEDDDDDDEDDD